MSVLRQLKNDLNTHYKDDDKIQINHENDINRNLLKISIVCGNHKITIEPYYQRILIKGDFERTYVNKLYIKAECDILNFVNQHRTI